MVNQLGMPMFTDGPVLVIGGAGVDLVGRLKGELRFGTSNPSQIRRSYGGVARNVAENLARLGQDVTLIAAVGEDTDGSQLIEGLAAAGVNTGPILRSTEWCTSTYLAVVNPKGELQFGLDDMGSNILLTPEYLKSHANLFKEAAMLFIDANLPANTLRTAISLAHGSGLPIVADPTSAELSERFRRYLPRIFMITPNSTEAGMLCGKAFDASKPRQALEAAKTLVSLGVQIAIITLGPFGVCYATSETTGYLPAIRTEALDPTGAGDSLVAAVIFALLNEINLDEAVRLGVSAAALTLRHRGAVVPDLSLEKLYGALVI